MSDSDKKWKNKKKTIIIHGEIAVITLSREWEIRSQREGEINNPLQNF